MRGRRIVFRYARNVQRRMHTSAAGRLSVTLSSLNPLRARHRKFSGLFIRVPRLKVSFFPSFPRVSEKRGQAGGGAEVTAFESPLDSALTVDKFGSVS